MTNKKSKRPNKYDAAVAELIDAARPFADGDPPDDAACHYLLTTTEKCGRCSRAMRLHAAIVALEARYG